MNQKEKLIDLIINTPKIIFPLDSRAQGRTYQTAEKMADHLLTNGVIAPPCKVGDTVYMPWMWDGTEGVAVLTVTHIIIDNVHSYIRTDLTSDNARFKVAHNFGRFDFRQFGEKVFTSQKEAEKALERSRNEQREAD